MYAYEEDRLSCLVVMGVRQVFPETEEQRCWVHKIANVLDKLPKRLQPKAKAQLHEIMRSPDQSAALEEMERFQHTFADKYPKAVQILTKDKEQVFTFFNYPDWCCCQNS